MCCCCSCLFSVFGMFRYASTCLGSTSNVLNVKSLAKWVRAEFDIFMIFLKTILDEKATQAKGNPFAQAVHDGGTLTSKRKYEAFGIPFC